jgi:hypothetical protein
VWDGPVWELIPIACDRAHGSECEPGRRGYRYLQYP